MSRESAPRLVATNEFKIEKGIPVPPRPRPGRAAAYPFASMQPGDSIFIAGRKIANVSRVASYAATRHRKKFTARTVPGGCRVWCIA